MIEQSFPLHDVRCCSEQNPCNEESALPVPCVPLQNRNHDAKKQECSDGVDEEQSKQGREGMSTERGVVGQQGSLGDDECFERMRLE